MSELILSEGATPSTPSTGKGKIFLPTQTIPTLGILDDAGVLGKLAFDGAATLTYKPRTSWTPGIAFGGGTTGLTYAVDGQVGRYIRLGAFIVAQAYIELSNKGSSTGAATITGLPVASANITNFFQACIARYNTITGITGMVQAHINPNTQTVALSYLGTGTAAGMDNTHFTNSSNIMITAIYQID